MQYPGLSVCALASGSRGNALFVAGGNSAVLVDAGLSGIEIQRRMDARGLSPEKLTAVVISHEHGDHIRGAGILSRRYQIPLYISHDTYGAAAAKLGPLEACRHFRCGTAFQVGDLTVTPFSISHDAADPSGFTFAHGGVKMGMATDLGVATHLVKAHLRGSALVYVEANHDPDMLIRGPYPWHLKQRVKSRLGHLSNQEAADLINEIRDETLSHVILGHLSEENNHPDLAHDTVARHLDGPGPSVCLSVATPDVPGSVIALAPDPARPHAPCPFSMTGTSPAPGCNAVDPLPSFPRKSAGSPRELPGRAL